MAENIIINFEVGTNELKDANKDLVTMNKLTQAEADAFKRVNDEAAKATASTKSLRQQFTEAKNEVDRLANASGGKLTPELLKATKAAASIKDKISDLNATLDALNPEAKLTAFVQLGAGISGAFTAAQGAMALFGNESEDVQKAILKVQGALALTQGLNSVLQLGDAFKNVKTLIAAAGISTNVLATANTTLAASEGAAAAGARAFGLALTATGIGAIVVAVGLLAVGMYKLSEANDDAAASSERLAKEQENLLANQKLFAETFEKALDPVLRARQREIEILEATKGKEAEVFKAKIAYIDAELVARRKALSEGYLTPEDEAKILETNKDLNTQRTILEIQFAEFRNELAKKNFREQTEFEKALVTDKSVEELMRWSDFQKSKTEEVKLAVDERIKEEERFQKFLDDVFKREDKKIADAAKVRAEAVMTVQNQVIQSGTDLISAAFANATTTRDQEYQNQVDLLGNQMEQELKFASDSESQQAAIRERYRQRERELKRRAWEAQKQADLEQIIINTALASITALATVKPTVPAGVAAAIAAGVAGAAQYAIAASQPVPKFAKGTLSVPGVNTGQDTVHAMLMPGEAVIPTATNKSYATAIDAIYHGKISANEINGFVKSRTSGAFSPYDLRYAMDGVGMNIKNAKMLAKEIGIQVKGSSVESRMLSKRLN